MRAATFVVLAAALAVGVVAYGRYERAHAIAVEQHRLLAARDAADPARAPSGGTIYNAPLRFTCAFYSTAELCFDPEHQLVETVVKDGSIGTVRWDHSASPWTMPPSLWRRTFRKQPVESYYP